MAYVVRWGSYMSSWTSRQISAYDETASECMQGVILTYYFSPDHEILCMMKCAMPASVSLV